CNHNRPSKSPKRKREQKKRWSRDGQKWRTGCAERISVVKRRNGLNRRRYKGDTGMQRWVALGVISTSSTSDDEQPSRSVDLAPIIARFRPPPFTPAGFALAHAVGQRLESINFAPGSRQKWASHGHYLQ